MLAGIATFGSSCNQTASGFVAAIGCEGTNQGLCVTRCNLGCSSTGCNITEIAVNQPLTWEFNDVIKADTVNSNTIRLRTPQGDEPVGTFLVQGTSVFFYPESKVIGTETFFGFESGKTYTLTIPSGDDALNTVESMSGDRIAKTFTCTLKVTRGIVDFDGQPPRGSLLVPSTTSTCSPRDTLILVEFSELVNAATLVGDSRTAGVTFGLAQFDAQGNCSTNVLPIAGTRQLSVNQLAQRTRLLFRPAFELPGDFCVVVQVTDRVRDLSGRRAQESTFQFKTCSGGNSLKEIVEDFGDLGHIDAERNGAVWAKGAARPGPVGGSGRLGEFDIAFGGTNTNQRDSGGREIWEWNTDNTTVPKSRTLSGEDEKVTNGVFEFTTFVLPESKRLVFTGSKPPLIKVTGRMEVQGVISMSAPPAVYSSAISNTGQPGNRAAIGGGLGGRGADAPDKPLPRNINGSDGQPAVVPVGHPLYGDIGGTPGKGSVANPESGNDNDVKSSAYGGTICQQGAAGGGGGGLWGAGAGGKCIDNNGPGTHPPIATDYGKASAGGAGMDFSKLLARTESSAYLFLLGGAGGGGGGTHAHGSFQKPYKWSFGFGGAGGGGPLWLQIGGDLVVHTQGRIEARGGDGQVYDYNLTTYMNPAPGGGGGGGTVLIQLGGLPDFKGPVDVTGGSAGRMRSSPGFQLRCDSLSGAGGDGFIRFESNPPVELRQVGTFLPGAKTENIGLLRAIDEDKVSMLATGWYDTNLFFPPKYERYVIKATVGVSDVVYSDDPTQGVRADDTQPVSFLVRGAQLDPDTKQPDRETISNWFVGAVDELNTKGGNGFQFMLRFNRDLADPIVIKEVKVFYRG